MTCRPVWSWPIGAKALAVRVVLRKIIDVLYDGFGQALNVALSGLWWTETVSYPLVEYIVKNIGILALIPHAYTERAIDRRVEVERFKRTIGPLIYNYVVYRHFLNLNYHKFLVHHISMDRVPSVSAVNVERPNATTRSSCRPVLAFHDSCPDDSDTVTSKSWSS